MSRPNNDNPTPPEGGVGHQISDQVSGQWNMVLAMMTQQGYRRLDLIGFAALTARTILTRTALPLWPDPDEVPQTEADVRDSVEDITRRLGALLHALGVDDD